MRATAALAVLSIGAIGACAGDEMSQTPTFEASRAAAEELARTVAAAFPGADELEFRLGGQLDCSDGLVYPVWEGVVVTGSEVSDADLDTAEVVLTGLGFDEAERHDFAAGPYRFWVDRNGGPRGVSITADRTQNHLWITSSGACATPPGDAV